MKYKIEIDSKDDYDERKLTNKNLIGTFEYKDSRTLKIILERYNLLSSKLTSIIQQEIEFRIDTTPFERFSFYCKDLPLTLQQNIHLITVSPVVEEDKYFERDFGVGFDLFKGMDYNYPPIINKIKKAIESVDDVDCVTKLEINNNKISIEVIYKNE